MKLLNLKQAVTQIKQACDGIEESKRSPFFFVVGAGISYPPVPLASDLVKAFRENAGRYSDLEEPQGKRSIDEYSHWFEQAYPQRIDRQRFLRELTKAKTISHANLRLAHLLLSRKITNLVVTTNFDDFLTRALHLFGSQQIVCDHPKTVQRIAVDEQNDIQIVHVHGTYWFYDCCNLAGEIVDRAQTDEDTYTMRFLLDQIMYLRSPIVVGYSGWEGDVFMTALERRLKQSGLPRRIYWFCYRRQEAESLPNWLIAHQDVCLVVPDNPPSIPLSEKAEGESSAQIRIAPAAEIEPKKSSEAKSDEPTLPARQVFDTLIEALGPPSPELTNDPLGFFSKQLTASLPTEVAAAGESDIYFISSVIERIERARKAERAWKEQADALQRTEALLESVRDAVRRSQYREAISQIGRMPRSELDLLDEKQLRELMEIGWSAALGLFDNSKETLEAYDLVIAIGDAISNRGTDEPSLRERVAKALVNKGITLGDLNRCEEAIAVYDEVVRRLDEASEPALHEHVAKALYNKGFSLGALNRNEEEIATYDEVVRRFGEANEPILRDIVANALRAKGISLGAMNRSEEAIANYDEVVRRFGEATEPVLRETVAKALINKGFRLSALDRTEEEIAVFDEVVRRFGEATEPGLREDVARALNGVGFVMICEAKRLWTSGNEESALASLSTAHDRLCAALERRPEAPIILGNLGYVAFLSGNKDEARSLLTRAIALGGEKLRQDELADADIHPLPQDEEFRELVRSIPLPDVAE